MMIERITGRTGTATPKRHRHVSANVFHNNSRRSAFRLVALAKL